MKFSQRMGLTPTTKAIQLDSIDDDLRNGLWNGLQLMGIEQLREMGGFKLMNFGKVVWIHFYKKPIDEYDSRKIEPFIRYNFFNSSWYSIYDFMEFCAEAFKANTPEILDDFIQYSNTIFEEEFSGYRFIDNIICPITNESEIKEIEEAIGYSGQFTSLKGVNIHLHEALKKLSDKKSPDYRNSIKESISAVESIAKVISSNNNDSLNGALDKIKGKIKIHQSLEKGFKQLYNYTSDGDGIRHALMDDSSCDFEDAKYMLVSSSAFINYLIVKADKAGINL
jgi:hypothetical protein